MNAAIADLKQLLPPDLRLERTSNEPEEVRHKITSFNRNLIEAIVIVVLVSLVFMEWRSALLVAICIPVTVAMTLGLSQLVGIDLQQVSIAALIIALGLLVDAPVVAADAINRELAHGQPRAHRGVARAQAPGPRGLLRDADQHRGVPAAAAGQGQDRRLHLLAADRRVVVAGRVDARRVDVRAAAGLLHAQGAEGLRVLRRQARHGLPAPVQGVRRELHRAPLPHDRDRRGHPRWRACCSCRVDRHARSSPRTCTTSSS